MRAKKLATATKSVRLYTATAPTTGQALIAGDTTGDEIVAEWGNPASITTTADSITDNGTGTASTTIAAGVGVYNLNFQFDLADIADGDLVSDLLLNHKFKILESYFVITEAVTTADKLTTLSIDISDVAVTNSAIALTSANCTPAGAKVQNAGALAANTGAANATLTIKAASTTAFAEGKGVLVIAIQNMDTADAIASIVAEFNELLSDVSS